jgi:Iap family predicted aminopeptidase
MINSNLLVNIKNLAGAGLNIPVVEGLRSDSLPTPCISVNATDMELFQASLSDVYIAHVSVKYEEHYADTDSGQVKANFDIIVDNFNRDNLASLLTGGGYHLFDARMESTSADVDGDIFCYELIIRLIIELKS